MGRGDEQPGEEPRYRAFISYSHRDAGVAAWLHRALESYRVPAKLVGGTTPLGAVPARLTPVFRDREELPAASDLTVEVRRALAASDSLIVICSPNAAASPWVAREIEEYGALHPDRPLLLAIADGEPADCFPQAVRARAAEPLAADLRKTGDGKRLGLLKLVAGMTGVPLDRLAQRDAQRRQRRVMAVTLGAIALALAMAVLLAFAISARSESERQRHQAEGLVEYMLTDLRDRLKGVGRLDVMTAVNERAMGYYASQGDLAELSDESLERRARILHAMGEDDQTRGDFAKAASKYREAYRATATLLGKASGDPERVFGHAQSEYWSGYIAYDSKNWSVARRHWSNYRQLAERLRALEPESLRSVQEVAYADGNLCSLALKSPDDAGSARRACSASLAGARIVAERVPEDLDARAALANRIAWLARVEEREGNLAESYRLREEQLALVESLVQSDPANRDYQDSWVTVQIALADLDSGSHRTPQARRRLADAARSVEKLIRFDPDNKVWVQRRRMIEKRVGNT